MQPDDGDDTVIRTRPGGSAGGGAEPADLEADTVVRPGAPVASVTAVPSTRRTAATSRPPAAEPPVAEPHPPEPPAAEPPALLEPPALVEPPRGHPPVVERPVAARPGVPNDPVSLTVPWHRIRVNRHEPIPLDVPALIGRRPTPPRFTVGLIPRLVRVPSPGREVSSTHVELRQQGASVVVTDLRSTNGTVVRIPGSSAQKLRQGESLVVSAGTIVDIGDGNTVEVLPIERVV
jgi:hypothetical protein